MRRSAYSPSIRSEDCALFPTTPIARAPALMCDGDDHNRVWIAPLDDRVRKSIDQDPSTIDAYLRTCVREFADQ